MLVKEHYTNLLGADLPIRAPPLLRGMIVSVLSKKSRIWRKWTWNVITKTPVKWSKPTEKKNSIDDFRVVRTLYSLYRNIFILWKSNRRRLHSSPLNVICNCGPGNCYEKGLLRHCFMLFGENNILNEELTLNWGR